MLVRQDCPRCHGDLAFSRDYGPYLFCIQCGYLKDLSYAILLHLKRAHEDGASKAEVGQAIA